MKTTGPIIYLDWDGVLNRHIAQSNGYCGAEPECVAAFNRIIRKTDPLIVLSSAWRYLIHNGSMTLDGFASMMATHGVDVYIPGKPPVNRVASVTRRDTMIPDPDGGLPRPLPKERGRQIADFHSNLLRKHADRDLAPPSYVVIDDGGRVGGRRDGEWCDMGIPAAGHPVVWTRGEVGLTEDDADRAIAMLKGQGSVSRP